MSQGFVETGVSFATVNGNRWTKHLVGLDIDYVESHLDDEAAHRFERLDLIKKLLLVRAVTELSVCRFRQTRHDPDYSPNEYVQWVKVVHNLVGEAGIGRLGV